MTCIVVLYLSLVVLLCYNIILDDSNRNSICYSISVDSLLILVAIYHLKTSYERSLLLSLVLIVHTATSRGYLYIRYKLYIYIFHYWKKNFSFKYSSRESNHCPVCSQWMATQHHRAKPVSGRESFIKYILGKNTSLSSLPPFLLSGVFVVESKTLRHAIWCEMIDKIYTRTSERHLPLFPSTAWCVPSSLVACNFSDHVSSSINKMRSKLLWAFYCY